VGLKSFMARWWLGILAGLGVAGLLLLVFLLPGLNKAKDNSPGQADAVATSTASSQVGDEYLALGDSVAFGVGASSPEQLGYPGVFYDQYLKKVRPEIVTYKNFALPGETIASFSNRSKSQSQLDRTLEELKTTRKAGHKVSLISLTIGGNDLLAARPKSQIEKTAVLEQLDNNFQAILAQLGPRLAESKTELIVTTYYNPYGGLVGSDDVTWIKRFNEIIQKRATEYNFKVADFFEPVLGHEKNLTWIERGDIHPNVAGHAALANALWQATGYPSPATTS